MNEREILGSNKDYTKRVNILITLESLNISCLCLGLAQAPWIWIAKADWDWPKLEPEKIGPGRSHSGEIRLARVLGPIM